MQNFKLKNEGIAISLIALDKDPSTIIGEGKLVMLDGSDLAIEATAIATKLAYAPFGATMGDTTVLVVKEKDAVLIGKATQVFAVSQKGLVCDLAISGSDQLLDTANSAVKVLKVEVDTTAGTVGKDTNIKFTIASPL